jgi:DNA polymerase elongation subunit (family B)
MSSYYTNLWLHKGKIYVKGIKNGKPHKEICSYSPYLFLPSKEETQFKTLWGSSVEKMNFNTISEAREFVKRYDDVEGFKFYGLSNWQYAYIYDTFPGNISYSPEQISVVGIDIENKMTHRVDIATSVSTVPNEITAITLRKGNFRYVFGIKDFDETDENMCYYHCKNERQLLIKFIEIWKHLDPDVITGWNVEFYDIPYIVNRIVRVLGEEYAKELSPWAKINPYEVYIKGKACPSYRIEGISVLDYMQLYKKFTYKPREKYTLDFICQEELNEEK